MTTKIGIIFLICSANALFEQHWRQHQQYNSDYPANPANKKGFVSSVLFPSAGL